MSKSAIEPRWHNIAFLPVLAAAMRENAEDVRQQARRMAVALERSTLLDRSVLTTMDRIYTENASHVAVFGEQLRQWRLTCPTAEEQQLLDDLDGVLEQWRVDVQTVVTAVKTLLERRSHRTKRSRTARP